MTWFIAAALGFALGCFTGWRRRAAVDHRHARREIHFREQTLANHPDALHNAN